MTGERTSKFCCSEHAISNVIVNRNLRRQLAQLFLLSAVLFSLVIDYYYANIGIAMDNLHDPTGPDPEVFKNLKKQLPTFTKALDSKRALRGLPPVSEMVPKKCCRVCGRGFEWTTIQGPLPEVDLCKRCENRLKQGETALICDNRFAFIKSGSLADKVGEIMEVSPEVMNQVQKHYMAEWVDNMEETKPKPNEPTDTSAQGQGPELN